MGIGKVPSDGIGRFDESRYNRFVRIAPDKCCGPDDDVVWTDVKASVICTRDDAVANSRTANTKDLHR